MDTQHGTLIENVTNKDGILSDLNNKLIDDDDDDGEISNDENDNINANGENNVIGNTDGNHIVNISTDLTQTPVKTQTKSIQEDELDFEDDLEDGETPNDTEKGKNDEDDENEDGEVNSEDDLEEGEVKEESEDESLISFMKKLPLPVLTPRQQQQLLLQQTQQKGQTATKSICKFFYKGQCTWGPSCRFLHHSPAGLKPNPPRKFPFPQPIPGPIRPRQPDEFFPNHAVVPPVIHPPPPMPRLLLPPGPPMPQPVLQPNPLPPPPPPPPQVVNATPPVIPTASSSHDAESAWERGLRHAKAMIIKATKRKEEEIDFDDKKFNLGVEDEGASRHSIEASPTRGRSPSPYHRERRDEYWSPEYERRRRLAFEAAPWNDEPSQTPLPVNRNQNKGREAAEQYRDPWRRSKSPVARKSGIPRRPGSSSGKRSHSMSSISGSDSGSDQSSSSFSSSFSGSDSNMSQASDFEKSPSLPHKINQQKFRKVGQPNYGPQKIKHSNVQRPKVGHKHEKNVLSSQQNPNSQPPSKSQARIYSREEVIEQKKKPVPTKARRDSWSDSDSGSDSQSDSSFYTGSESGSEAMSESDTEKKNIKQKRVAPNIKQPINKQQQRIKEPTLAPADVAGPSKRAKTNQPQNRINKNEKQSNKIQRVASPVTSPAISPYSHSQPTKSVSGPVCEGPQKRPIKMTFMKKHQNLQKDVNVAAKLNGGRGSEGEDQDDAKENDEVPSEVTSPEPLPESSCKDDIIDSPKSGSKDSLIQSSSDNKPKSSGSAVVSSTTGGNSSTSSRREELLKQLKAVEDAIARKRAKLH